MLKLLLMTGVAGPVVAVVSAVATVFQAAVAFFSTTLGKYVGIGLIGLALFAAGDIRRGREDAKRWAETVAQSQEGAKARDAKIAEQVSADAKERIASLESLSTSLQAKVDEYAKIIAEPAPTVAPVAGRCPATACKLGSRDVKQLLNIK